MQTPPVDAWQILAWQAAIGAALVAALAAVAKGFWALWQQHKELRWKKAELARTLTDTWFSWEASHNALRMADDGPGEYSIDGYGTHHIDPETDIARALAVEGAIGNWRSVSNSEADRLVQKSFDVLLYCFERIQHSIDIGVVDRADVLVPARYYVDQLTRFYLPLARYLEFSGFLDSIRICNFGRELDCEWNPGRRWSTGPQYECSRPRSPYTRSSRGSALPG